MEVVKMILSIRGDTQLKVMFPLCNWWHERNAVREGEQKRLPNSIASLCWKQTLEVTTLNKAMQQNGYRSEQGDKMATTSTGAPENQC
jgi:hypothetical protein